SFDPKEQPRLSLVEAFRNVASSIGVIVNLLSKNNTDFRYNNLRGAFIAGLSHGLGRCFIMLQEGEDPVPIDYRDLAKAYRHPTEIDKHIAAFVPLITARLQETQQIKPIVPRNLLEKLDIGATAAENEVSHL